MAEEKVNGDIYQYVTNLKLLFFLNNLLALSGPCALCTFAGQNFYFSPDLA
ncbi:hypothetical protein ABW286_11065 [Erwinia papayae]|uniref:Uncharacterized protein n=1 Tax=Erwinia papayae TaxID=206499 RepID=A0ABV3N1M8_9GAMM